MTTDTGCSLARPIEPVFEYGFWWWYDATRKGWFVGTAPQKVLYAVLKAAGTNDAEEYGEHSK